jgi:hypothetical protein
MLLGDAKVGREDIFKPTNGNESLLEISNNNGIKEVNFAAKNLIVKSTIFLIAININTLGSLQMGKPTIRLITF